MSDLTIVAPGRGGVTLRTRAHRLVRRAPLLLIVPLLTFGSICAIGQPNRDGPPIHADGVGYYAWTEAILDGDFDFCQWQQLHGVKAISARNPAHPQRCENKYPPALALLRLPIMGPISLLSDHGSDARLHISGADEDASEWLGLAALLTAAVLMWATLRQLGVSTRRAQAVVLALVFGTGLFHYGTFDSSYAHIYSAALFAGLIYAGVAAARRGRGPRPALVFGLSLFIAWIRQPDILPLALLIGAWVWHQTRPLGGRARLHAAARLAAPAMLAIVCVCLIQILYNRWSAGIWTVSSYGNEPFSLAQGDELEVLLSADHGLFTWYPVTALMLAVGFWRPRSRPWAWLAAAAIALLTVVYGSWNPWDLGGSMGMRGMVDIVPVIALPGGVGLATLSRRALTGALACSAVLALVTVELMWGYWVGPLPIGGNTGAQYVQQVVGRHSLLSAV